MHASKGCFFFLERFLEMAGESRKRCFISLSSCTDGAFSQPFFLTTDVLYERRFNFAIQPVYIGRTAMDPSFR